MAPRPHLAGSVLWPAGDIDAMAGSLFGTFDARAPAYHFQLENVGLLQVRGGWSRSAAQRLAAQIATGGISADNRIDGQQVLLSSWKGGEGFLIHEESTPDRYRRGEGVDDFTQEGAVGLGPYMAAPAALQLSWDAVTALGAYRGYLMLGRSDGKVYTWDGTTLTLAGDTGKSTGGVRCFTIFENHLYIGNGQDAKVWRWQDAVHTVNFAENYTVSASSGQTVTGVYAMSPHVKEGTASSFYGAEQSFTGLVGEGANTAGSTVEADALKLHEPRCSVLVQYKGKLVAVGADSANQKWSLWEGDASNTTGWEYKALTRGGYVTCGAVLDDVLYLGDAVGGRIWSWDGDDLKLARQLGSDISPYAAQITGMAAWRGGLWVSIVHTDGTMGLLRFDGNKSWGRPVTGLSGTTPGLVAVYADQLHVATNATGAAKVFRTNGTFGAGGFVESGLIDARIAGADKHYDMVTIRHSALVSGQSVAVAYKLNDTGSWTTLGTSNTVGATSAEFRFANDVSADLIAFKITLVGAAGSSTPLVVYAMTATYRPSFGAKRKWQATVDLMGVATAGDGARLRRLADGTIDTRTGEEISDQIWLLIDSNVPVAFLDKDRRRQYMVTITDYSEQDANIPKLEDDGLRAGWDLQGKLTLQEV